MFIPTLVAPVISPNGIDDTTTVQLAITQANGGPVWLASGIFKISSPLAFTVAGSALIGAGIGATVLQIKSTFSGSSLFTVVGANKCIIRDVSISGISSTYSSNPACDAILVSHSNDLELTNVFAQYINGWGIEIISDATADSYFPRLTNCHTSQCKQGCHLQGTNSADFNMGAFLVNCNFENSQAGDSLFLEDVHDVTVTNLEGYSIATGNAIHIKGNCAAIYFNNVDVGALVSGAASPTPTMLIESSAQGSPSQVIFNNTIIEDGIIGASVTAGSLIRFSQTDFIRNGTVGLSISGNAQCTLADCDFKLNGFTAGSGHYDISATTSADTLVTNCEFFTPSGSGSGQVESVFNISTGAVYVFNNKFAGAAPFVNSFPTQTRGNLGWNPVGPLTAPGIPASTVALQNPFGVDCMVYIVAGTITVIGVGNSTSTTATGLTSNASGVGVFLGAGQYIKMTYSVAPTSWAWMGL